MENVGWEILSPGPTRYADVWFCCLIVSYICDCMTMRGDRNLQFEVASKIRVAAMRYIFLNDKILRLKTERCFLCSNKTSKKEMWIKISPVVFPDKRGEDKYARLYR
jgi:hypothetical protein